MRDKILIVLGILLIISAMSIVFALAYNLSVYEDYKDDCNKVCIKEGMSYILLFIGQGEISCLCQYPNNSSRAFRIGIDDG